MCASSYYWTLYIPIRGLTDDSGIVLPDYTSSKGINADFAYKTGAFPYSDADIHSSHDRSDGSLVEYGTCRCGERYDNMDYALYRD